MGRAFASRVEWMPALKAFGFGSGSLASWWTGQGGNQEFWSDLGGNLKIPYRIGSCLAAGSRFLISTFSVRHLILISIRQISRVYHVNRISVKSFGRMNFYGEKMEIWLVFRRNLSIYVRFQDSRATWKLKGDLALRLFFQIFTEGKWLFKPPLKHPWKILLHKNELQAGSFWRHPRSPSPPNITTTMKNPGSMESYSWWKKSARTSWGC